MSDPVEIPGPRCLTVTYSDYDIVMYATRLRDDDGVKGEIEITSGKEKDILVIPTTFNFTTNGGRRSLVKDLKERFPGADYWDALITNFSYRVITHLRKGEDADIILGEPDDTPVPEIDWILYPLIPRGGCSLLYGDEQTGKTTHAVMSSMILGLPWNANPLGWHPHGKAISVLYLNWELRQQSIDRLVTRLKRGHDIHNTGILFSHRHCSYPLADDFNQVQHWIYETGAECLIIDSLALAAGTDDINKPKAATDIFSAANGFQSASGAELGIFMLGHESKDKLEKNKTPFGSVFFRNLVRNRWHVTSHKEGEHIDFAFIHQKAFFDRMLPDISCRISYTPGTATYSIIDKEYNDAFEDLAPANRKEEILEQMDNGPVSYQEIARRLKITEGAAKTRLYEMQRENQVVSLGRGMWKCR